MPNSVYAPVVPVHIYIYIYVILPFESLASSAWLIWYPGIRKSFSYSCPHGFIHLPEFFPIGLSSPFTYFYVISYHRLPGIRVYVHFSTSCDHLSSQALNQNHSCVHLLQQVFINHDWPTCGKYGI